MTPDQAAQLMHERALMLVDYARNLQHISSRNMNQDELLYICLTIMNLYAESLWNMGDILEDLGKQFNFNIESLSQSENNETQEHSDVSPLNDPPFDKDFFLGNRGFDES